MANRNNVLGDAKENMKNLHVEMMTYDNKALDNSEIDMVTCTPVLAGRKLGNFVPSSPFLSNAREP
jgi:hypothetical protein